MVKLQPRPLKYWELLQKLAPFGIIEAPSRGKGSERILIKPLTPGSLKGPQYPIKHHGAGTEISIPVIKAVLRRFNIRAEEFWKD